MKLLELSTYEQPAPTKSPDSEPVMPAVLRVLGQMSGSFPDYLAECLTVRAEKGEEVYGMPLSTNDGRHALADAWQEGLDFLLYVSRLQMMYPHDRELAEAGWHALRALKMLAVANCCERGQEVIP